MLLADSINKPSGEVRDMPYRAGNSPDDMPHKPKIFIVDDDPDIIRLFESSLQSMGTPIHSFASAEDFLAAVKPKDFGCLILDLALPNMSGTELQRMLVEAGTELKIVIVSGFADVPSVVQAFRAGAVDVIQKPIGRDSIREAVRRAMAKAQADHEFRLKRDAAVEIIDRLSPREKEVLARLVAGRANKQAAVDLELSVRTVEVHRAHIMAKLSVRSFAEAMHLWLLAQSEPRTGKTN